MDKIYKAGLTRKKFFSFPVNDEELEIINREAYLNRVTKSEYVRRMVFNSKHRYEAKKN